MTESKNYINESIEKEEELLKMINEAGEELKKGNYSIPLEKTKLVLEKKTVLKTLHLRAYDLQGLSLFNLKRYDESLESFNNALNIKPNDCNILFHKILALIDYKKYEDAKNCIDEALSIEPHTEKILKVRQKLEQILEKKPNNNKTDGYSIFGQKLVIDKGENNNQQG